MAGVSERGFDRLTERQQACLRLVLERRNSSEIARTLAISPHAVDKSLKLAMAKIGVNSRFEAARLFAAHEATVPPLTETPSPSPTPPDIAPVAAVPDPEMVGVQTSDPQIPDLPAMPPPRFGLPIPTRERPVNTLAWWQIALWGIAIGGAALVMAVVAVALLMALNQLFPAPPPASG